MPRRRVFIVSNAERPVDKFRKPRPAPAMLAK